SSWYFLRYMDAKNEEEFASKEAMDYWQNVDLYMGGSEHATGHLLYARFWQKFLFDRGLVPTDEFAKKLINQGMILGMSAFAYRLDGYNIFVSKGIRNKIIHSDLVDLKEEISLFNSILGDNAIDSTTGSIHLNKLKGGIKHINIPNPKKEKMDAAFYLFEEGEISFEEMIKIFPDLDKMSPIGIKNLTPIHVDVNLL